ncbi:hypothetical protein [Streptomyces sp. NBC_00057]|uniref:hypothetical protein n=1 Tax=Streptomyces sp. NBC_00057 TaxID=2975634 RepID=UPI00324E0003
MVNHVPLSARTDPDHGGRWTSLRGEGREWLWHRPDPARATVRPGDAFVDAGGLEECVPTVRGLPDHGDAWSRRWRREDGTDVLDTSDFTLRRSLRPGPAGMLCARYHLSAEPGYRLVWAGHALLDLTEDAYLAAPEATPTRLFRESAPLIDQPWPADARHVTGPWPAPFGLHLNRLGPDDGTAVGAILTGCRDITVVDGADRLSFSLHTDADVPVSVALWRNLRGYPCTGPPYRSIGVEPMLGAVFDLAEAGPRDAATVPPSGELRWELRITATRDTTATATARNESTP